MSHHLLVLIAGGHSSGKNDVTNYLKSQLENLVNDPSNKGFPIIVKLIDLVKYDRLEYDLTYRDTINQNAYKPSRYNFDQLVKDLDDDQFWEALDKDKEVTTPTTTSTTTSINNDSTTPYTTPKPPIVAILTGTYALYDERIRDRAIMKVYLDVDDDTRLSRLILKDVKNDHSRLGSLLDTYLTRLRPEMTEYILPTKQYADVILTKPPSTEGGEPGVQLIATGVYDRIKKEYYKASDSSDSLLTLGKPIAQPPFRYRRESFVEQRESYYSLN